MVRTCFKELAKPRARQLSGPLFQIAVSKRQLNILCFVLHSVPGAPAELWIFRRRVSRELAVYWQPCPNVPLQLDSSINAVLAAPSNHRQQCCPSCGMLLAARPSHPQPAWDLLMKHPCRQPCPPRCSLGPPAPPTAARDLLTHPAAPHTLLDLHCKHGAKLLQVPLPLLHRCGGSSAGRGRSNRWAARARPRTFFVNMFLHPVAPCRAGIDILQQASACFERLSRLGIDGAVAWNWQLPLSN